MPMSLEVVGNLLWMEGSCGSGVVHGDWHGNGIGSMATIGVDRRCGNLFVDVQCIEVAKGSRWHVHVFGVGLVGWVGWLSLLVVDCLLSIVYGNLIRGLLLYLFLTIRSLFNFMLSVVDFNLEAKSRTWGGNV